MPIRFSKRVAQRDDNYSARLPPEVLSKIFALVFLRITLYHWITLPYYRRAVVCVCWRWKQIAYTTPELWTALSLHRFTRPAYIAFCVARSRAMPLEVYCDSAEHMRLPNRVALPRLRSLDEWSFEVLGSLEFAAPRVRNLRVDGGSDLAWRFAMFKLTEFDWSALVRFQADIERPYFSEETPFCILALNSTASRMTFRFLMPRWTNDELVYSSLTHLTLEHITQGMNVKWATVASMLEEACVLHTLVLLDVDCGWEPLTRQYSLPRLQRLDFAYRSSSSFILPSAFNAPVLTDTRITVRTPTLQELAWCGSAILSGPQFVSLVIGDRHMEFLDRVIGTMSNATDLSIHLAPRVLSDLVDVLATMDITHLSALRLVFTLPPRVDDVVIGRVLRRLDTSCRLITTPTSPWRKAVEWRLVEERACGSDITDDGVMSW
ncbi:hypothetical protein C8R44DRAFT_866098 [Mycena epipterygia]|nr:hypothetical protein C8R44DRAFT_866098 [Mycena epipterygia]